ncbi:MAG TPA: peptidoglycan DD-metalloendopeptidase family protein [Ktedonobacteraceae bacterium]|nr:peptidoglycan DD-metalloendopeptidase family protein [Ktedonobacteraceae bacterium]
MAKPRSSRWFTVPCILILIGITILPLFLQSRIASGQEYNAITAAIQQRLQKQPVAPFLHRPYYGNSTILQRTVSFVDHDKPWYDYDNKFVRFDGQRWTGNRVAVGACGGNINCYDGHNGYDLNLWYEPVLSSGAGTVIRANWYNPLNHNSSLGLWAAVDHGNGMVSAYGHLSALTVTTGDHIGAQWQVGTSGTTGASTGPHLHMATYYLPYWQATDPFGWRGNYADPNVVPDQYLWVGNPAADQSVPNLSGSGRAVYPGATLVDDGTSGWSSTGQWHTATSRTDISGDLRWTDTTETSATASATWHPTLPADGYYEVAVFVDDTHASSSWVPYTVYSASPTAPGAEAQHHVYVDSSHIGRFRGPFGTTVTGPQWVSIGTYYFRRAQNGRVVVDNATGESGQQIAADGVEFVRVSGAPYAAASGMSGMGGGPVEQPLAPPAAPTPETSSAQDVPSGARGYLPA